MADLPNPDDFSFVDSPNEFRVRLEVKGEFVLTVMADSPEDARSKAVKETEVLIATGYFEGLDEVQEVEAGFAFQAPRMYRVTSKDGRKMRVSRLEPGMVPREPDEHGF
ncbi:hypothetical protein [Celeribacter sp. SCSIO 80788]|uniref:hypothetical protein n=1 Tax=Celeribacter sp. SCSIO 80788 TaxID=3117013 RepID=UPI003DA38C9C